MLFAVLAIVAAVAVFALDEGGEYPEPFIGYDSYEEYVEWSASDDSLAPGEDEYEAYIPEEQPSYIPTPPPVDVTPEETPGATPPGQEAEEETPSATPQAEVPEETPAPGDGDGEEDDENEDDEEPALDGDDYEGYEEYEAFEPLGDGYEPFVPFNGGDTVTFVSNNPHAGAPAMLPLQATRVTNAAGIVTNAEMPNPPTWGGRYFLQWNTEPLGTGTAFTGTTPVSGDMTVYAQWAFEVTFMGNGVTLVSSGATNQNNANWYGVRRIPLNTSIDANNAHVNPAFQAVWPNPPSEAGFTFEGWYTLPAGGVPITGATVITGETAAFARWTLSTNTVIFDVQGGALSTAQDWIQNPADMANQILAGHSLTRTVITGRNIDFSGHQARQQFRQNIDMASPRSAPEVTAPPPPAGGGTPLFLQGWWTQPNGYMGAGTRFAPPAIWNSWNSQSAREPFGLATTVVDSNLTVYAHWTHRIYFQHNGATAFGNRFTGGTPAVGTIVQLQGASAQDQLFIDVPSGLPAAQNNIGTSGRLQRTAPSATGYVPLTRLPGATELQTVTNASGNPSTGVTVGGTMTRSGHEFGGWWIVNGGQNTTTATGMSPGPYNQPLAHGHVRFTEDTDISLITHANSTVVAHWVPNPPVAITFNPNGGEWTAAAIGLGANTAAGTASAINPGGTIVRNVTSQATFANCSISGTNFPPFPTRPGYIFLGWHQIQDPGDGSTELGVDAITVNMTAVPTSPVTTARFIPTIGITGSQTFYARWLPSAVTLVFEANFTGATMTQERHLPYGWTLNQMHNNTGRSAANQGAAQVGRYSWSGWGGISPFNQIQSHRTNWVLLAGGSGSGFNRDPNGIGGAVTATTPVNTDNGADAVTGRLYVYAQWGAVVTFNSRHQFVYGTLTNAITTRTIAEGHTVANTWQHPYHPNAANAAANNFPGLNVWDGAIYPAGAPTSRTLERPPGGAGDPIASMSFAGWNTGVNSTTGAPTGVWWTPDTVMVNGAQQVQAIWHPRVNFRPGIGVPTTALSTPFGSFSIIDWSREFNIGESLFDTGGAANMPPNMGNAWLGHIWRGWFPNPDGTGAERDFDDPLFFARTYYASFYAPVTFWAIGGTFPPYPFDPNTRVPVGHPMGQGMPDDVTRPGWSFNNRWNTQPDNTGLFYDPTTPVMSGRNLYATWEAQISFTPGTAPATAIQPGDEVRFVPEGFTLDENPPGHRMPPNPIHPNPAYDFDYWRIISITPNVEFFDNMRFGPQYDLPGNITVEAQWIGNTVNITFDFAGGTQTGIGQTLNTQWTDTIPRGSIIEWEFSPGLPGVPVTNLTRPNYTFAGTWLNTSTNQIQATTAVGGLTADTNLTFVAQWNPNPFLVTFELNSGTYNGNGANVTHNIAHGSPIGYLNVPATRSVPPSTLERPGHTFVGWQQVIAGGVTPTIHSTGAVGMWQVSGSALTFRANWSPTMHPVTFVLAGGNVGGNTANVTVDIGHGATTPVGSVPTPLFTNRVLLGWQDSVGVVHNTAAAVAGITINGPTVFTAVWDIDPVQVTFVLNGGVYGSPASPANVVRPFLPAGEAIGMGNVPIPTRPGHTFAHWSQTTPAALEFNHAGVAAEVLVLNQPRTFTAQWTPIQHPVTFVLSGGSYNGSTNPVVRDVNQGAFIPIGQVPRPPNPPAVPLPGLTNGAMTFLHWVANDGTTLSALEITTEVLITGPMVFTAVWDHDLVPITFDLNFGNYNGSLGPIIEDFPAGLPIGSGRVPIPVRDNFSFLNWREADPAAPGGYVYRSRQEVGAEMVATGTPRTFVAQWGPIIHQVTFQLSGGTYNANPDNVIRTVNQGTTVPPAQIPAAPGLTNSPQVFSHWLRAGHPGEYSNASAAALQIMTPEVFIAVWDYERVDVIFDLNTGEYDGNPGPITRSVRAGVAIGLGYIPTPTHPNYVFVTWREYNYPAAGTNTDRNRTQVSQVVPALGTTRTFVAQWSPIQHPVTFILSGGTYNGSPANVVRIINQGQTVGGTVPGAIFPNQTFMGWRNYDGAIWDATSVSALVVNAPSIFTAVWSANLVNVTFELAGGNVGGLTADIDHDLPAGLEIGMGNVPFPARDNYTFVAWQEVGAPDRTPQQVAGVVLVYNEPRVFTAVWTPVLHPVTFIMAGGTYGGSPNPIIHQVQHNGSLAIGQVPDPINPPQGFQGWNMAGTADIWDATSVAALAVTGPVTFTAVWEHGHAAVTFVLAGGEYAGVAGPIVHPFLPIGEVIGASHVPAPSWEFRSFRYWAVMDGANIVATHSALQVASLVLVDDIEFTAVWERISFPVTFSFDGGSWQGSGDYFIRTYDNGAIILPNDVPIPTRLNYTLVGWRRDDIGQPLPASSIEGIQVTEPMTFVAVWVRITHPVTFEMNGGLYENSPSNFVWIVGQGTEIERVPDPVRTNYEFIGWREYGYPAAGYFTNRTQGEVAAIIITGPRTFTAQWRRLAHPVTFDLNSGLYNGSPDSVINIVNQGELIGPANIPAPALTGSTLTGWRADATGAVLSPGAIAATIVVEPLIFIAIWDANIHPVTFNFAGGEEAGSPGPVIHSLLEGALVGSGIIPSPVLDGFELTGWRQNDVVLTMTQVASVAVSGPLYFTAVWAPLSHPVTFDLNGGSINGSTDRIAISVVHGNDIGTAVPANPAREYSAFAGWREEGTNTIRSGAQIADLTVVSPMAFIAQWDLQVLPVIFVLAGGNVGGNAGNITVDIAYGSPVGAAAVPEPVRTNYVLTGWSLNPALSPMQVAATIVNTPLTFTAQWEALEHPVTFHLAGGTYNDSLSNVVHIIGHGGSVGITNVPTPTRSYMILHSWREDASSELLTAEAIGGLTITGPRDFVAVWLPSDIDGEIEEVEFTLIFDAAQGALPGGASDRVIGEFGHRVDNFPTPIPPEGYQFIGWFYNGGRVIPSLVLTRDMTLVAMFAPIDAEDEVLFTVIYDPGPGLLPAGTQSTQQHPAGTQITTHPTPTRNTYTFGGWLFNGAPVPNPLVVVSDKVLTALWTPGPDTPTPTPHPDWPTPTPPPDWPTPTPPPAWPTPTPPPDWPTPTPPPAWPTPTPPPAWPTPTPPPPWPTPTPPPPWPTPTPPPGWQVPPAHYVVVFNPFPGAHLHAAETGLRHGERGFVITNIPATPVLAGHVFGGWRLPNGNVLASNQLVITGNMTLTAIWTPIGATPCPSSTPGPSSSSQPSPCPSSKPPGNRPNPQTSPMQISFMVFGAVMLFGVAGTGVWTLTTKHAEATGQQSRAAARHDREKRLFDAVKKGKK